jgi:hypothetical protein
VIYKPLITLKKGAFKALFQYIKQTLETYIPLLARLYLIQFSFNGNV